MPSPVSQREAAATPREGAFRAGQAGQASEAGEAGQTGQASEAGEAGQASEAGAAGGRRRPWGLRLRGEARPFLIFALAWLFLSVSMNARYPAWRFHDPHRFWFLPSPDVTLLFGGLCVLGRFRRRLPAWAVGALVGLFLLCRVLRVGDGITGRFYKRTFSIVVDGPLVGELVRLLWSTTPRWKFALGAAALVAAFAGLSLGARAALRYAEGYLARPAGRAAFGGAVAIFGALSVVAPAPDLPQHRNGAFGTSAVARLTHETDFLLHLAGLRQERWRPIREASARVEALPAALPGLGAADVFLFLVESYGHAVVSVPAVREGVEPAWRKAERALGAAGYAARSSWLEAPTYGGGSWLAQASLASGAKIADQFAHHLLADSGSKSLVWALRRAGYRAVFASPAITRRWEHERFFAFDKVYSAPDFGYRGPAFSWATMPDQYAIDVVHRREVEGRSGAGPLFVQYALVSSHGPFDVQPPLVDDWARLGDGSVYHELEPVAFRGLTWANQHEAGGAYARAIAYDFEVLTAYLAQKAPARALFVVLGDHQPTPELTGGDPEWTVPVHVLSRDPALLAPFERRGYGPGLTPSGAPRPMESLLFTLFESYAAG